MTSPIEPVFPKPKTIVVRYRNESGKLETSTRQVHFLSGYGHYIRWNKRMVLVDDPTAFVLTLDS